MEDSSRRRFLKQNLTIGIGSIALGVTGSCSSKKQDTNTNFGQKKIETLADLSLEQLHERYRNELFNRFLPAMNEFSIDNQSGGFMCNIDIENRTIINTDKKTWFQGRGIWVYSFLYNNFEKKPEYLEVAKKAIDFILNLRPKGDDFWTDLHNVEGMPISGPGDIYGDLFVAEGLAEYSKATGDKQYLNLAKEIIFHCLERYDRPDYVYDISYAPGKPEVRGPRVLGHWMIFLSLSTQILKQGPDPDFEKLSDRCIEAILKYHMNPEFRILNEVINHDLTLPENEYAQFSVIGHGIETLAFVMAEAVRRNDQSLLQTSGEAFKRHVEVAADKLYGGYFEVLYNANNYTWSPSKSAWCQQEILIGTLLLLEHTGDLWARECFSELDAYVQEKMVRPEFAFCTFGGDRKMERPSTGVVEHYHMPRHLMRNMLALERMMKNTQYDQD